MDQKTLFPALDAVRQEAPEFRDLAIVMVAADMRKMRGTDFDAYAGVDHPDRALIGELEDPRDGMVLTIIQDGDDVQIERHYESGDPVSEMPLIYQLHRH